MWHSNNDRIKVVGNYCKDTVKFYRCRDWIIAVPSGNQLQGATRSWCPDLSASQGLYGLTYFWFLRFSSVSSTPLNLPIQCKKISGNYRDHHQSPWILTHFWGKLWREWSWLLASQKLTSWSNLLWPGAWGHAVKQGLWFCPMAWGCGQGKFLEDMTLKTADSEHPIYAIGIYLDVGIPMNYFHFFLFAFKIFSRLSEINTYYFS